MTVPQAPPAGRAGDGFLLDGCVTSTRTGPVPTECACACADELARMRAELAALREEVRSLSRRGGQAMGTAAARPLTELPAASALEREQLAAQRIHLFPSVFSGRADVDAQP